MKIAVFIVALLSAIWTLLVGFSAYMTTTGSIDGSHFIQASIPLVVSLALSSRLALRDRGPVLAVVAMAIALIPFLFLGFIAGQQAM